MTSSSLSNDTFSQHIKDFAGEIKQKFQDYSDKVIQTNKKSGGNRKKKGYQKHKQGMKAHGNLSIFYLEMTKLNNYMGTKWCEIDCRVPPNIRKNWDWSPKDREATMKQALDKVMNWCLEVDEPPKAFKDYYGDKTDKLAFEIGDDWKKFNNLRTYYCNNLDEWEEHCFTPSPSEGEEDLRFNTEREVAEYLVRLEDVVRRVAGSQYLAGQEMTAGAISTWMDHFRRHVRNLAVVKYFDDTWYDWYIAKYRRVHRLPEPTLGFPRTEEQRRTCYRWGHRERIHPCFEAIERILHQ